MLVRCGSCDRLVRSHETVCPFCSKSMRRRIVGKLATKIAVGAIGGATAMLSGIGCAYGCPDGCLPYDSGTNDTSSDVTSKDATSDASSSDAKNDVALDAETEAGEAGVADASDAYGPLPW